MPRFRQTVSGHAVVYVEAEDMYEADEKIAAMTNDEVVAQGDFQWHTYDTDEFPEEV